MSEQNENEGGYPKMLFPGGDPAKEHAIADDAGQEAALRKEGYKSLTESKRHPDDLRPGNAKPAASGKKSEG